MVLYDYALQTGLFELIDHGKQVTADALINYFKNNTDTGTDHATEWDYLCERFGNENGPDEGYVIRTIQLAVDEHKQELDEIYNFKQEISHLTESDDFYEWMLALDNDPVDQSTTIANTADIKELGIAGFCEDVALYFYCSYKCIDIIETVNHFCVQLKIPFDDPCSLKFGQKYFDSFNSEGVEEIKDLEYFKRNPKDSYEILDFKSHEFTRLPDWYYLSAKACGLPFADRIKPVG